MPLYMDIHTVDSESFTVEDVVKAHMQDLAIQDQFGVTQIKYWVNVDAQTIFCLMQGPDKNACHMVHKESHGGTACNIIEVSDDEFNLYLGEGKKDNDLAYTNSGELDTGYRTVLLLRVVDFTGQYGHTYNEIHRLIKQHQGTVIIQPEDDFMVSFVHATDAILCGLAIGNMLQCIPGHVEFNLALASGRPVDEHGTNLFEETKKKVQCFCDVGLTNTMYLDAGTRALSEKEHISSRVQTGEFKIVQNNEILFMIRLFDILNRIIPDPDFKSEDLNALLGLSKSQAYRKIKSLTGLAPNKLIQEVRLRKALKKLKKSGNTIAETAYDFGFNSPTYFTRVFKNRFHVTPTCFSKISPTK